MSKVTTNELKKSQKEMITVRWLSVCAREYTLSLLWRIDIVDGTEMDCGPYAYRTQKLLFFFISSSSPTGRTCGWCLGMFTTLMDRDGHTMRNEIKPELSALLSSLLSTETCNTVSASGKKDGGHRFRSAFDLPLAFRCFLFHLVCFFQLSIRGAEKRRERKKWNEEKGIYL